MSMISDPESWIGLRSSRSLEGQAAPPAVPEAARTTEREPENARRGGLIRRLLALFGRD